MYPVLTGLAYIAAQCRYHSRGAEERKMESEAPLPSRHPGSAGKSQVEVLVGAMVKSAAHAIGSQIGRQIIRGVLGSILGRGR